MATNKKATEWEDAKKKCKLNAEILRMAKELGLNPRSLIKNIPNKSEQWKAPVSVWIEDIYEKGKEFSMHNLKFSSSIIFSGNR